MSRLRNKTILLTRPRQQSQQLRQELEARGAVVLLAPLIRTEPVDQEIAKRVISRLAEFDWIVFTSVNGVEFFQARFSEADGRMPEHLQVAAIGPATADAARRHNWKVSLVPESANSEGLIKAFQRLDLKGKKFVLFLAEKTRDILPGALTAAGVHLTQVAVYRTVPDLEGAAALRDLAWSKIDAVVFMSGSAAAVFASSDRAHSFPSRARYCAVGQATAQRMRQLGLPVDLVADQASVGSIVRALEEAL